jgi:acyl-CoA synthetase (AMP-forming)/AMP-acid ligase II
MSDNYAVHALRLFEEFGDREAVVAGDRRLSYVELRTLVVRLASALHAHGVRGDATVAVVLDHVLEGPAVLLALHLLGCRTVWVRSGVTRREVDGQLSATRPDVVVYDDRSVNPLGQQVGQRLGVQVLRLETDLLTCQGIPRSIVDITGAEPETVFQTSGTTGAPKLVHHRHEFYWQIHRLAEQVVAAGEPRWRHLSMSVLSHVSGQLAGLLYLFCGGVLILMEGWDPVGFLSTVERERVSSTFIPPPDLYELLGHPALGEFDTSSLRMLSVGAAPAAPARLLEGISRFGRVLRITYGLSECPFISANAFLTDDPAGAKQLSSAGLPYGDVTVEIRAGDGITVLGAGEVGELWVRSNLNFAGYFEQPELTADTLLDGWVRTHDLGYRDPDGFLYLVGRSQDVIISGRNCRKVFPRPIEDALAAHPRIRAAAVIGVPDPTVIEAIHAYVVATPGASVTEAELITRVRTELTDFWTPRTVEFVDRLPINGIGKVDKNALRAHYAATHDPLMAAG